MELILDPDTQLVTVEDGSPTISVLWDRAVQLAVINTSPGPTIASRAYAIVHTAIFDAWSAYNGTAISTQLADTLQRPTSENTTANKAEAMSFAAFQVLSELFPSEVTSFRDLMTDLGYDPDNATTDTTLPAGIGNVMAEALMVARRADGSNQLGDSPDGDMGVPYSNNTAYTQTNPDGDPIDIELWTPELVPIDANPGDEDRIQSFLTPQWGDVTPFSLASGDEFRPPSPEPFLTPGVNATVDLDAKTITLDGGFVYNINKNLIGPIINPAFVAQAEELITISANLTDEQKLIAEFWEDGGGTSFPPGTWMTFGQFVSARDNHSLDQDAQLFFALGNAVFDAGIATWEAKLFYDYTRPVRAIRELGELGLVGEFNESLGGYAIEAWGGPGEGTETILATDFLTYQTPGSDPSPPFPEYTSGHSAFSAAGAEILRLFTGSNTFGGSVTFGEGEARFEPLITPSEDLTLAWDTFTEAADEAGISRIYGGIHFDEGDIFGRELGRQVGQSVLEEALGFINGGTAVNVISGTDKSQKTKGTNGDDYVLGLRGKDQLLGKGGNDRLIGGIGKDTLEGNEGDDQLSGGDGNDELRGNGGADTLMGGSDKDFLVGAAGDDILFGGGGKDTLKGSKGRDLLVGEQGEDVLMGNQDGDGFVLSESEGPDLISDWTSGVDQLFVVTDSGLTAMDLEVVKGNGKSTLRVTGTGEKLGVFMNVKPNQLDLNAITFVESVEAAVDDFLGSL